MTDLIPGMITIAVGVLVFVYREKFARGVIDFQNKTWGFHFGEKEINACRWFLPVWSVLAIVMGILSLFGLSLDDVIAISLDYINGQ